MIKLLQTDILDDGRHSSKGNQLKWKNGDFWYKADYTGYEGLSEYICSKLLCYSTLGDDEYILYDTEIIEYNNQAFHGCVSKNFLMPQEQLITLERLFMSTYGTSLHKAAWNIRNVEDRLKFITNQVKQMTGISEFGKYINKVLTIDAFFLNEDRHMHNLAVIKKADGTYRLSPIFDNGSSLMSDTTMDYPVSGDIYQLIPTVKAKTVSSDFNEQLDAAEHLYGRQLNFSFSAKDVERIILEEPYYSDALKRRTIDIIREQIRRYPYFFK